MRERIDGLLATIGEGIYEKETTLQLALLAALAGESILLLGPPGVGKSMIARRMKMAFADGRSFEYLMSRFSTPDEIFGPVSISRLKESDDYVRAVDGYMPTADVVFLDEIWKAGPAIQNSLLTALNERLFRNGRDEIRLPMKLLIAASNELPARGEGLEALWDRFLIRLECHPIASVKAFDSLLTDSDADIDSERLKPLQITHEEYTVWQKEISQVVIPGDVIDALHVVRDSLHTVSVVGSAECSDVYVSDRRWRHIARLLRAEAFAHDRKEVSLLDIFPIYHALWQEPVECDDVRHIVLDAILRHTTTEMAALAKQLQHDIEGHRPSAHLRHNDLWDDAPQQNDSVEHYYSRLEAFSECVQQLDAAFKTHLFISADDMKMIKSALAELNKRIVFMRQDLLKLD